MATRHAVTSSGVYKMQLFDDGISKALKGPKDAPASHYEANIKLTRSWIKKYPSSPLAFVLHARALDAYAMFFRGTGYANTVSPEAGAKHDKYARQAFKVLLDAREVASKDTSWHVALLSLGISLGMSKEEFLAIVADGIQKNPDDYRIYRTALEYFRPRWYGDIDQIDAFIRFAEAATKERYGAEIYSRLYSSIGETEFGHRLYIDSKIDWNTMKEGLELRSQRFPTAWNKNIHAYHACMAKDKAVTRKLLQEVGEARIEILWEPNGEAIFSGCRSWANKP